MIRSRNDLPVFIERQQVLKSVKDNLTANITAVKRFREEVESLFTQIDLYRTSKLSEIARVEKSLEATVNICVGQVDSQRYSPVPAPRNRLEYLMAQGASLSLADLRKELTFFSSSTCVLSQVTSVLDSIQITAIPGVNARAVGQVAQPPVLAAVSPTSSSGVIEELQRKISELTMENAAKDQTMVAVKNNRDEMKEQFAGRRQEYEAIIKELKSRAGAPAAPTHLQDTIQDLRDERRRLQETLKQYEEALKTLKSQFQTKLSELQSAKDKIETDAVKMALILRDKLPEMERTSKALTEERSSLIDLRNKLESMLSSVPVINVGCIEGKMVMQAKRLIAVQKNGGVENEPTVIRVVMMGI